MILIILIIIIFLLIIFYFVYKTNIFIIENFEDHFQDNEKYEEIYDKEFTELYEIIYRDFTDINNDLNIIYKKTINDNNDKNNLKFAVLGSGIGKICKKIKEKYSDVIGVDISENMLLNAQSLYPNVKFLRGNIIKNGILKKNEYSHIIIDERTLYYNKEDEKIEIIRNCFEWLRDDGYLVIQIYNPSKLQLASRYYSSKYIDNKGNIHGFTYLNDFSHDCYYIKDDENENIYDYFDKVIFETGEKRIKKTRFYIPPMENVYDMILNNGFDIVYIEKIHIQIVGGYELAIFKKKKQIILVEELEKNKK